MIKRSVIKGCIWDGLNVCLTNSYLHTWIAFKQQKEEM